MKMEITVTEALELINEIRKQPNDLFEMIRADVKESVGHYLSELMDTELSEFLGRKRYERIDGMSNHRNGSYARKYTLFHKSPAVEPSPHCCVPSVRPPDPSQAPHAPG